MVFSYKNKHSIIMKEPVLEGHRWVIDLFFQMIKIGSGVSKESQRIIDHSTVKLK